jgi:hypothetical protein
MLNTLKENHPKKYDILTQILSNEYSIAAKYIEVHPNNLKTVYGFEADAKPSQSYFKLYISFKGDKLRQKQNSKTVL